MRVLKFGGSSVGNTERIRNVIKIIDGTLKRDPQLIVVLSALQGVTDKLISLAQSAAAGEEKYKSLLAELCQHHLTVSAELLSSPSAQKLKATLELMFQELEGVVCGVSLVRELSPRTLDCICSFGERLSVSILCEALKESLKTVEAIDARNLIKTDNNFGAARVLWQNSAERIRSALSFVDKKLFVITGFIASTEQDETTTLGRGGSDYSASLIGAALGVDEIEIWSDVNGVMTADPRKVRKAFPLSSLTYEEAMELSHFGAKVIHPPTIQPACDARIPLVIRNSFQPDFLGTRITVEEENYSLLVKGISSIPQVVLLRLEGSGMIGVAGTCQRLFSALARKEVSVILISQASSEHSICLAIKPEDAQRAQAAINDEFLLEIETKRIEPVNLERNLAIIAAVGSQMRHTPGISGKLFQALGRNGINVVAIAQGSSELNISVVIRSEDEAKALNALHDAFFLSETKTLNLFLLGPGQVGSTLLAQLAKQEAALQREQRLEVRLVGLANTKKALIKPEGISLTNWHQELEEFGTVSSLTAFLERMNKSNLEHSVFVDCSASAEVAQCYSTVFASKISVVTPNKKANSAALAQYYELKELASRHNVCFFYEANVGAGLPVLTTIADLMISGDEIMRIEGVLSGTLSFIFNSFGPGKRFSEVVREAKELGYTEPDPRDDLSGVDVARKLLILAREVGLSLEQKDISIEPLLSESCLQAKSVEEFFAVLAQNDASFEEKRATAQKLGQRLRYIATLNGRSASIALEAVGAEHPFYGLSGADNIISFTTTRYCTRPLVIRGPGAGTEVTAAGVFADMMRVAHYLM